MKEIPISVVMPVYNGAEHLRVCLDSILSQTFRDFELLIVDDGSTDNTCEIIESYDDARICLVRNKHDYIASCNLLLSEARGKYIARMDADDIMMPDRLAYQYEYMESHPEIDILGGGMQYFGDSAGVYVPNYIGYISIDMFVDSCPLAHPTIMLRRQSFIDANIKYESEYIYAEDYNLWVQALKSKLIVVNVEHILIKYRISKKQISCLHATEMNKVAKRIQKEICCWQIQNEIKWALKEPVKLPCSSNLLTVIIPFLNEKDEVKITVEEVRRTAGDEVDIIVINDCSYDGYSYGKELSKYNVFYILNKERKGVAASRDLGVRLCNTPYFILLDAHMRFYDNVWHKHIVKELCIDNRQLLCCQTKFLCKHLQTGMVEVMSDCPQTFGAYSPFNKKRIWPDITWNLNELSCDEIKENIPTVLGAGYATSKYYWTYLRGLEGLRNYGSDESYISFKVWLEGGKCVLLKNVVIGHVYRNNAPYQILRKDSIFNQLLISKLLFPQSMFCKTLALAMNEDRHLVETFIEYYNEERAHIDALRKYYCSIFKRKIEDVLFLHYNCRNIDINAIKSYLVYLPDIYKLIKEHQNISDNIYEGNSGFVLWLCHYSRFTNNICYDELASLLWEKIEEHTLQHRYPWGFKYGISGIGWCALYLWSNGMLETYPKKLIDYIDEQLVVIEPNKCHDMSFETGISGVFAYLCFRLRFGVLKWSEEKMREWCKVALQMIDSQNDIVQIYYALLFFFICKYGYDVTDLKPTLGDWAKYPMCFPKNRKYWDLSISNGVLGTSIAFMNLYKLINKKIYEDEIK